MQLDRAKNKAIQGGALEYPFIETSVANKHIHIESEDIFVDLAFDELAVLLVGEDADYDEHIFVEHCHISDSGI